MLMTHGSGKRRDTRIRLLRRSCWNQDAPVRGQVDRPFAATGGSMTMVTTTSKLPLAMSDDTVATR